MTPVYRSGRRRLRGNSVMVPFLWMVCGSHPPSSALVEQAGAIRSPTPSPSVLLPLSETAMRGGIRHEAALRYPKTR